MQKLLVSPLTRLRLSKRKVKLALTIPSVSRLDRRSRHIEILWNSLPASKVATVTAIRIHRHVTI